MADARRPAPWAIEWPEIALIVFTAANLVAMHFARGWETLPFHFIYVSVTIAYGLRAWRTGPTIVAITLVSLATGAMTLRGVTRNSEATAELLEVPLMSMMFVVMVVHVQSRRRAADTIAALAADRADALERERRFFADASHELVTPLTIARGQLEVAGRERASPDELEVRDLVLEELGRMEELVAALLQLGRIDDGYVPMREHVTVAELADAVEGRWGGVSGRAWSFERGVEGSLAVDRTALGRALDAVIDNAFQHTGPGEAIAVEFRAEGDRLEIVVRDGGEGIPPEALPHVGERFYRADPSRSRRTGGAGLGLSIASAVVASHGGDLRIESAVGEGTAVTLSLPRLARAGRGARREASVG